MDDPFAQFSVHLKNPFIFDSRGFIAGQWTDAPSGKTFPVYEPSSGQILAHCTDLSQEHFVKAIESAHSGFRQYSRSTTAKDRGTCLRKWNDLILENAEDRQSRIFLYSLIPSLI